MKRLTSFLSCFRNAAGQQELQQVKSDKACLAEDLAQAYRLKDDWANKHIACRDTFLSASTLEGRNQ